jgi:hypothetical protein
MAGPGRPPKKPNLMDETELLVIDIVKSAKEKRVDADGTEIPPDTLDRVRAADVALRFMSIKAKIAPPEETESDFEKQLKDLHGVADDEGEGSSNEAKRGAGRPRVTAH